MNFDQLEKTLAETFQDLRLDDDERAALDRILDAIGHDHEKLAFVRNRAFDLAAAQLGSEESRKVLKWLENLIKRLDRARNEGQVTVASAHFSPGKECLARIVELFNNARMSADICVFTITDDRIKAAILNAFGRGCKVRIITDDLKQFDPGSDVKELADRGIPIATDKVKNHMHHKFAIFDDHILLTGSFNWTRSASSFNQENMIVSDDRRIVQPFQAEFDKLWEDFYSPDPGK